MTSVMTDYIHVSDGGEVSFIPGEMTDNRTTELREKLKERGIEYATNDHMGVCETSWNGFTAMQLTPGAKLMMAFTPEQAIATTLGSEREKELEQLARDMYEQWAYSIDGYYRVLLADYRKRMAKLGVVSEC